MKRIIRWKSLIVLSLLIFLLSIVKVNIVLATIDSFTITDAEIKSKSGTTQVNNFSFKNHKIMSNVTFHEIGDSITYKIKIKNNDDKSYNIKSVVDDNKNDFISCIYDKYEKTVLNPNEEIIFEITTKYITESDIVSRNQNFSFNLNFALEDENGNLVEKVIEINPKTGDNVLTYLVISIVSLIMLAFVSIKTRNSYIKDFVIIANKNSDNEVSKIDEISENDEIYKTEETKKNGKHCGKGFKLFSLFVIGFIMVPTISKAISNFTFILNFENTIDLKDKLAISYTINDTKYELVAKYNEKITLPENPEKEGYTFIGWQKEDGTTFDKESPITDDLKIVAVFKPITYTIEYDLDGGNIENKNPQTYNIETDDIILNRPVKEGYEFAGWTGTDLVKETENVTISKGSIGNRTYKANWKISNYSIKYHLNGGTVTGNPTTYTINTDNIVLNKPVKEAYTFIGWTGTDLSEKTEEVTIVKGSTGNKEYTANWTPINYTITYEGLTDEEEANLNNPTTYNIETPSIKLNNPADRTDKDGDKTEKFIGWKEKPTISTNIVIPGDIFENKTYEAIWQTVDPNVYTITYDLNNGTLSDENPISFTKFSDTFTLNNPTKRGFDFAGWTGSNGTEPQITVTVNKGTRKDLNYVANWTPIDYTITYQGLTDEEKALTGNPTTYRVTTHSITLNNPTKRGYTFTGWTGTDLPEQIMEVVIPTNSIGNKEYTANFEVNNYTIIFNNNTGSGSMPNQDMTYDVASNLSENLFTKTGYTFKQWNTKPDGSGTSYNDKQSALNLVGEGTITLYAQWEANNYTVVFNKNDDNATGTMEPQLFKYDETKNLTQNSFTKENYVFTEWNLDPDGNGAKYTDKQSVTNLLTNGEITLYAQWTGKTYKIIFDKNNENATGTMAPQSFKYDKQQNLRKNAYSCEGYTFAGWTLTPNGSESQYDDEQSVKNLTSEDTITLYAKWDLNTYTVSFDKNDENATGTMEPQTIRYTDSVALTANAYEKTGYHFTKWTKNSNGTGEYFTNGQTVQNLLPSGEMTLYAQWEANNYTVIFDKNDSNATGTMESEIFTYDTANTLTKLNYSNVGHTFAGWALNPEGTGTIYEDEKSVMNLATNGEITLYAKWNKNRYEITFNKNNENATGTMAPQSLEYNVETPLNPNEFVYTNKVFKEWNTSPDGTGTKYQNSANISITGNITLYAQWRDFEGYTINFDSDGGTEIASINVTEGNAIGELPVPTKENFKFRGWYTNKNYTTKIESTTKPTGSTTYYAKWVDKLATVFSIENAVTFNGKDVDITDAANRVPAQYLGTDSKYVDSHIALFSEANYDKDFEIGFTINSYNPDDQDEAQKYQYVFVNTKDENGSTSTRPGFVFRIQDKDKSKLEFATATTSSSNVTFKDYSVVKSFKIFRQNKKLYYSLNGGEKILINSNFSNYTGRFDTTATFGASVKQDGSVFRHLTATLSHMYIKLEVDD